MWTLACEDPREPNFALRYIRDAASRSNRKKNMNMDKHMCIYSLKINAQPAADV